MDLMHYVLMYTHSLLYNLIII